MKKLAMSVVAVLGLVQAALAAEGTWLTDFDKAQTTAKEEKKLVLMDFTGSDWCPPCKQLHKNVLTSKEFVDFASTNLVLVLVDFPNNKPLSAEQKSANQKLADKFNVRAFPTIVVLDGNGKQLSFQEGYEGQPAKEFVAKLKSLKSSGG